MTPRLRSYTHIYGPLPSFISQRIVHAKRARTLRRRGEQVLATGERTSNGKWRFVWFVDQVQA